MITNKKVLLLKGSWASSKVERLYPERLQETYRVEYRDGSGLITFTERIPIDPANIPRVRDTGSLLASNAKEVEGKIRLRFNVTCA